jgi:hydroxypyruvate isomerase
MIKFAANLAMLFNNVPLAERFRKAADSGFRVVEIWSPVEVHPKKLAEIIKDTGIELLQFNLDIGDLQAGDRGLLALPDQKERFRSGFERLIPLAGLFGARQFNGHVGNRVPACSLEEQLACMRENLEWLHPQLEAHDLYLNIEPLSEFHSPNYLFPRSRELFSALREFGLARIGVQYDLFHAQLMEGNLLTTLRENLSLMGHIQVADAPDRHQPGTGEINYRNVLAEIEALGYDKYVGLEYDPLGSTEESLDWLPVECRVQARARDLEL